MTSATQKELDTHNRLLAQKEQLLLEKAEIEKQWCNSKVNLCFTAVSLLSACAIAVSALVVL